VIHQSVALDVKCQFQTEQGFYQCMAQNVTIKQQNTEVTGVTGKHKAGKTNDDVKYFRAYQSTIRYFPLGIDKQFKNIEKIFIVKVNMAEVHQSDLKPFTKLTALSLGYNNIQVLEADLFKFNPKLAEIYLEGNKLKLVEGTAFNGLTSLNVLDLSGNLCITKSAQQRDAVTKLIDEAKRVCNNKQAGK
jgi:Leucine rich repeat